MANKDSGVKKNRLIRDNSSMGRVVYLRQDASKRGSARSWSPALQGRSLIFLLIATFAVTSLAFTASGSSFDYYPETCIGSWKTPENAQGKPNIKVNLASARSFNENNSAVFFGGTHSIICQSFSGEFIPEDSTLSSVILTLSLAVKRPLVPTVQGVIPSEEGESSTTPADVVPDGASGGSGDEPITDPSLEGDSSETPADVPGEESVPVESEAPVEESTPAPVDDVAPAEESTPASEPTPAAENSSPSESSSDSESSAPSESSGSSEPSAFLFPFIKTAHAQEEAGALATVLYSLDGIDWQALGQITNESWQNLSFKIPIGAGGVNTIADLSNLRIRLDAGFFGVDSPTEIYLDGFAVEVNTDEFVAPEEVPAEEPANLSLIDSALSLPVVSLDQVLSLERQVIPAQEVLPWQPYDYQIENVDDSKDITRSVATVDQETDDIILSGSCKKDYFTVLVFSDPEAYANAPRTALFNSAYPCKNGLYSYRVSPATLTLPVGTYYLLVADQPEVGPWIPISAIMPFTIEKRD